MSSIYNQALLKAPKRNKFPLGRLINGSWDIGYINPVECIRMMPGDTFSGSIAHKIRTFPMKSPAYQQYDVGWFVFFCPYRLLMENSNWQKFIAEDENAPAPAFVTFGDLAHFGYHFDAGLIGIEPQSLANYLGLPVITDAIDKQMNDDTPISLAPFLAYQKIYDEWFRDNNIITSHWDDFMECFGSGGAVDIGNGDTYVKSQFLQLTKLQNRSFKKDRFTSAMPETQKGSEVIIPLGTGDVTRIPVQNIDTKFRFSGEAYALQSDDVEVVFGAQFANGTDLTGVTSNVLYGASRDVNGGAPGNYGYMQPGDTDNPMVQIQLGDGTGVYVDISTIPGVSVNAWRTAVMTQSFLERLETCGSRYTEVIRGMFGVFTPDARLQRPELVKAWRSNIMIGDVLQSEENVEEGSTEQSPEGTPAGTLRGLGLGVGSGASFKYRAYEHGFLIVLMSILPRQSYSQGIPRMFTDIDRYDFFWPLLAHQGEEPIKNRELYFQPGNDEANNGVFGYQSRYYDWRSNYDRCVGLLAPGESLDFWQGSRKFDNLPTLSAQFIECRFQDSDQDRLFPMNFYPGKQMGFLHGSIYVNLKAWRPCPKFATPAII